MKLVIVVEDTLIIKDGVPNNQVNFAPLSSLAGVWAIHWDDSLGATGEGVVEYTDVSTPNQDITSIAPYQEVIDAYDAWEPTPPTLAQTKAIKVAQLKTDMIIELEDGFTCANLIKMDSTHDHVKLLKDGYDLATLASETTMDVRDFNNTIHVALVLADVATMLTELGGNLKTKREKLWGLIDQVNSVEEVDPNPIDAVNIITW